VDAPAGGLSAGAAVGGTAFIGCAAAAAFLFARRRRRRRSRFFAERDGDSSLKDRLVSAVSDGGATSISRPQGGTGGSDVEIAGYTSVSNPAAEVDGYTSVPSAPSIGVVIDGQTSATGIGYGGGAAMPTPPTAAHAEPFVPAGQEPDYDPDTGAPVNAAARRDVAREWASGVGSDGAKARVVKLPFREIDAATNRFDGAAVIGNGASCAVFRCRLFGLPAAVKR
jgi:hypothetical protein